MSNILKRKNEDDAVSAHDQLNKRVALDSEQLDEADKQGESAQTAPKINSPNGVPHAEAEHDTTQETTQETHQQPHQNAHPELLPDVPAVPVAHPHLTTDKLPAAVPSNGTQTHDSSPSNPGTSGGPDDSYTQASTSKPVSSHRDKDDPDHVSMRMYCPVKEAGTVVGKKGEKITHIREKANVRIYVSENLKNVPERVISVKGSAENVARAFGLITRTILDEPEDEPASMLSKQYSLKLLVPHPLVGYIIGKSGCKFREIEENSAAKLKAAEQALPYSTDRVLSVVGVGDAIHIAIYYICQVILEHKDCLKKHKIIYYNPANFRHQPPTNNPMMNMAIGPGPSPAAGMPYMPNTMQLPGAVPGPGMPPMKDHPVSSPYQQKPYDFQMMFQPSVRPQYSGPSNLPASTVPPQNSYTDEHGNNIVGDVITNMPVQIGTAPDRFTQDVFVANTNIGSVIGKGGNNIKQIRESSGCTYVKIEPDQHQSILLGGGKGLTNIRKLTLTGTYTSIQTAIFFINQRINADKERNGVQ
ncbi:hypothetical protein JCM33374_g4523 [Metschnikowia sp. JCM 33374]|nr:hypothetical protein JCM33374_g4523 [Metschnikowia sp. JCM 33374]